jgi:DNA-binding NarL/FixJ family response regulator
MPRETVARATHAIDVVEAAYSLTGSEQEWLDAVLGALGRDVDLGGGAYAFTGRLRPGGIDMTSFAHRNVDARFLASVAEMNRDIPSDAWAELASRTVSCGGIAKHYGEDHLSVRGLRQAGAPYGVTDALALFARDAEGCVFNATGLAQASVRTPARVAAVWRRVGIHVVCAARLRHRLGASATAPEALLDAGGTVHHAEPSVAADRSARDRLAAAARAIDRARTTRVRATPERALELWEGLVAGRWSLVDHWESEGRRYIAAFANQPEVPDPRSLSPQERIVVRYVVLGSSNKEIAFSLGLPLESVETAVSRILRKLRCRRRSDLVALGQLGRWEPASIEVGDAVLDVVSVDTRPHPSALDALTRAERDVVELVLSGHSNRAIARARRSSVNTVANQLRAIYGKVGVTSRAELVHVMTKARP